MQTNHQLYFKMNQLIMENKSKYIFFSIKNEEEKNEKKINENGIS